MQPFSRDVMNLDPEREIERITREIRRQIKDVLRRRGAVIGLSGGIDSSVCAALLVKALGPERVFGLMMPEEESASESLKLARELVGQLGIESFVEPISPLLDATHCYHRRDLAIRRADPTFVFGERSKLVIHTSGEDAIFHFFSIVTEDSEGRQKTTRLSHSTYLEIVAASNFKQRSRKMLEYFHGDRLHYAVCGTPNRLEYDQGFFVKNGDGASDFKPIAHLYKSQVYQLAKSLDIPDSIRTRPPTTDTYSLPQSQEEFYFSLPFDQMDLCLYGVDHNIAAEEVATALDLPVNTVRRVYLDIATKRRTTEYLHLAPLLIEDQKRI